MTNPVKIQAVGICFSKDPKQKLYWFKNSYNSETIKERYVLPGDVVVVKNNCRKNEHVAVRGIFNPSDEQLRNGWKHPETGEYILPIKRILGVHLKRSNQNYPLNKPVLPIRIKKETPSL